MNLLHMQVVGLAKWPLAGYVNRFEPDFPPLQPQHPIMAISPGSEAASGY
jgi:hypothetical protein